jgi:hypothetical protein
MNDIKNDTEHASIQLTLRGKGLELIREIPASLAEQIAVMAITGRSPSVTTNWPVEADTSPTPPASLVEWLQACRAERIIDKIIAIGIFFHRYRDQDRISRKDIALAFQELHDPLPKNLSRDVKLVTSKNWLAAVGPDQFYVTRNGYSHLGLSLDS